MALLNTLQVRAFSEESDGYLSCCDLLEPETDCFLCYLCFCELLLFSNLVVSDQCGPVVELRHVLVVYQPLFRVDSDGSSWSHA